MRRKKVTLVAKTNVLKTSLLWKEVVDEVAKEYGDVESDYLHVDNASMQLILSPRQFDVLLTENMFGDILSDEASVLPGSIGLLPSASLGDEGFGMYEPIHGSAPSIADQNIANPTSQILCVAGMLKYTFGMKEAGEAVERAVEELLTEGYRTADLFGKGDDVTKKLGTKEWGDAVVERLARDY
ncbi:MAG: 3-isopropylmalate dehydrogenase, partial [Bdellovibrionales bacterium]|nr:3-isopropylmalate dehydrogenase [Bdellovibrionales bacterium]